MRVFVLAMPFPRPTNMLVLIIKVNIDLQLVGIKVAQSSIHFLDSIHQFDQKKAHMMLVLMFDPKFLRHICCEQLYEKRSSHNNINI
jgi:hypothetical protein